ncbi:MAG: NAD-dependent deacylase [Syntrophobacterales bacterium]|jgi:NAD-dependent deacetylase|nr:NAD-dependent deacylase [Syntrophobacterales bacterium]
MKAKTKEITPAGLAALIRRHPRVVALTGAGISVESGIPSFRGAGGLWDRFDPMEFAHIRAFRRNPAKVWQLLSEMDDTISRARPNPAHYALAALEAKGFLTGIITQNVDNLHQAAGSRRVVEYHGNALRFVCDTCKGLHPRESLDFFHPPLYCLCGGLIRPDVVFFGEAIPARAEEEAEDLAQHCDLLLVIGTSGEVAPASYIPAIAREWQAVIVENNLEPTRLTYSIADHFLPGSAGKLLPLVLQEL